MYQIKLLNKIAKPEQSYNIPDKTFSNWYGKRDPYAFYKGNYAPRLSWTKVGIGENQDEALDDKHVSLLNKFTDKVEDLKQYYYLLNKIGAPEVSFSLSGAQSPLSALSIFSASRTAFITASTQSSIPSSERWIRSSLT